MQCNVCKGEGFVNHEQLPQEIYEAGHEAIASWIAENEEHDVAICHCCGDGEGWYGEPGQHYGPDDPAGPNGPYAYNGGLCECH